MPRYRRHVSPNALIHIIARFLNHEYLLNSPEERGDYLRRVAKCFGDSDWSLLAYALMSSHTHFAAIAGKTPFGPISRSLHSGYATWLNHRRGRLGPAMASRPTTKEFPMPLAGRLIAYLHNNPVRAGVVSLASESNWTSHGYYVGEPSPAWLCVAKGLELSGFATNGDGDAFDEYVNLSASRGESLEIDDCAQTRKTVRARLGTAVELASPRYTSATEHTSDIWVPRGAIVRKPWTGDVGRLLRRVAAEHGLTAELLQSRSRVRSICAARRVFITCCHTLLCVPLTTVAGVLGMSVSGAHKLKRSVSAAEYRMAWELAKTASRTKC